MSATPTSDPSVLHNLLKHLAEEQQRKRQRNVEPIMKLATRLVTERTQRETVAKATSASGHDEARAQLRELRELRNIVAKMACGEDLQDGSPVDLDALTKAIFAAEHALADAAGVPVDEDTTTGRFATARDAMVSDSIRVANAHNAIRARIEGSG